MLPHTNGDDEMIDILLFLIGYPKLMMFFFSLSLILIFDKITWKWRILNASFIFFLNIFICILGETSVQNTYLTKILFIYNTFFFGIYLILFLLFAPILFFINRKYYFYIILLFTICCIFIFFYILSLGGDF